MLFIIIRIVIMILFPVALVIITAGIMIAGSLNNFIQLPFVKPYAPALRAVVDFNAIPF
jgi:hypothetical protein